MNMELTAVAERLQGDEPLQDEALHLHLDGCVIRLRSNSASLLARLRDYFAHLVDAAGPAEFEVLAIERAPLDLGVDFQDWVREPGKRGRKDACHDLPGGRLILKLRTGMLFLQSESRRIAAGPCLQNDNQVINFINAQYMNWLQHRGCIICHASGLVRQGNCLGIAGFSGGGKSTLMLHLLAHEGITFLTNDRLFACPGAVPPRAYGVPKQPRVNPGTIVHDPLLQELIPQPKRERLLRLPSAELWEIEEKYDVMVEQIYGPGKQALAAPLAAFLILNWEHGSRQPLTVEQVDLSQRRDLLQALMKSPGPFYQYADGSFHRATTPLDEAAYLQVLQGVVIHEARGGVDFPGLTRYCLDHLL